MKPIHLAAVSTISLALAACGGTGSGGAVSLVSTPPPPIAPSPAPSPAPAGPIVVSESETATPIPSPANRTTTFDTIALVEGVDASGTATSRNATVGQVRIEAHPDRSEYTLIFAAPEVPIASARHTFEQKSMHTFFWNDASFGAVTSIIQNYSDGSVKPVNSVEYRRGESTIETATGPSTKLRQTLVYDVGLSYVALGEWAWRTVAISSNGEGIGPPTGRVLFVNGDRTPEAAIPVSGTATYTASSLGYDTDSGNRDFPGFGESVGVMLRADFAQRSMFAQLSRSDSILGDAVGGYLGTLGFDVQGTGPIAATGDFLVPLSGNLTSAPARTPVTGTLNGAFFGPSAEQVGGVFSLGQTPGGPVLVSDAFVGVKN